VDSKPSRWIDFLRIFQHVRIPMNNHFRLKPAVVTAITFSQLVQHGREIGGNIIRGMPQAFLYSGRMIYHANDQHYLVTDGARMLDVTSADVLVVDSQGLVSVMSLGQFAATYEPV
jgi:hypothetical protein